MLFKSINPKNGEILRDTIPFFTRDKIEEVVNVSYDAYQEYKDVPVEERIAKLAALRENLEANADKYAKVISKQKFGLKGING